MNPSTKEIIKKLDNLGYCIVKNVLPKKSCNNIKLSIENTFAKIKLINTLKMRFLNKGKLL